MDAEHPANRLNDGFVDAAGRLWFGTMDNEERAPTGSLYRLAQGRLERMDAGYVITNGPAMSPDGRVPVSRRYPATMHVRVRCRSAGSIANKRVFARVSEPDVYPDGPAVDAAGNVWVAMFGGWGVRCYSPQGELLRTIDAAGRAVHEGGLRRRRICGPCTSRRASVGLSAAELARQPLAGGLFRTRVEVAGLEANRFAG